MADNQNQMNKLITEIKANPLKLFGIVFPYIFIIGLAIGLIYTSNINNITRQKVPPKLIDTTKVKDLPVVEPKTIPPIDIFAMSNPNPDLIDKGKKLFTTICVSCHGADGKGDGPAAAALSPKPRNFTSKEGWVNGPKISQIFTTLSEGISGSGMAAYDYLTPEERISLAHYLRSEFIPNPPLDTKDDLSALDQTYNLSKGSEIPAQIPVAEALKLIEKENSKNVERLNAVLNKILADKNSDGAKIFDKVTNNKFKALTLIFNTPNWKQSEDTFINSIVSSVVENGFNSEVLELKNNEWNEMYKYVSSYF